jgi:hypothetical protein
MSLKQSLQPLSRFRAAAVVLSLMAGVAVIPACAQQAQTATLPAITSGFSIQNLQLFSSSAAGTQDDATLGAGTAQIGPNADANPQYGGGYGGPPRRRPYGRPTYRDRYTNADGSSKIAWEAGAGFAHPAGSTQHYQKTGYNLSFGAGENFNRAFGVLLQYDFADMGVANYITNALSNTVGTTVTGNTHLWSITLNPIINFSDPHSHFGAYITGGGGFYRKLTTFTEPNSGVCYDYYYGYYACAQNLAHWSNNAGGLNGGLGFTYKPSAYSNLKIFSEARYTWVDNQASPNNTSSNGYPPANYRTGYFPVTFGVRF